MADARKTFPRFEPRFPDRLSWTVPHVLRTRAASHGPRTYLEVPSTGERYSYLDTLERAERVASGLRARGHQDGDRVIILMANCSEYIFSWLGIACAGMVEVPINTAYKGSFLSHQVSVAKPAAVITTPDFAERFLEIRESLPSDLRRFFLAGADAVGIERAARLLTQAEFEVEHFDALLQSDIGVLPEVSRGQLAAIFFTSGTTGPSKGVMMSHSQMTLNAEEGTALTRLTEHDTYLSVGPLFHGNSHFLAAYPSLLVGARYVMRERFSASKWSEWVRESGVTVTNLLGVMMDFINKQEPNPRDADNQLRCIYTAPTASAIAGPFKQRFGTEALVESYGLTEGAIPIMSPYGEERPPGAAGRIVADWFEVKIVDPITEEEVEVGQLGEILIRPKYPYMILLGYYGMADRTAEALRDGWLHTGDGVRMDDDGWYYFVDRLKDSIRRRGENISSYEVEQGILTHPAVAEAAVVAVPADESAGEDEVMACIVLAEGGVLTPEELWQHCESSLPSFAVPRYLRFMTHLPKTPSEKIQKIELRKVGVADAVDRKGIHAAQTAAAGSA